MLTGELLLILAVTLALFVALIIATFWPKARDHPPKLSSTDVCRALLDELRRGFKE